MEDVVEIYSDIKSQSWPVEKDGGGFSHWENGWCGHVYVNYGDGWYHTAYYKLSTDLSEIFKDVQEVFSRYNVIYKWKKLC